MEKYTYTVNGKEYTRSELVEFGEAHYPKRYWIPRGIGLGLMLIGILYAGSYFLMGYAFMGSWTEDSSNYLMIVAGVVFLIFVGGGLIPFCISFRKQTDETYIRRAIAVLEKQANNQAAREAKLEQRNQKVTIKQEDDAVTRILKYKELLDQGIITQEEFDQKKDEILK